MGLYNKTFPGKHLDKGGQVFDVKHPDFGAVGNGTTDDLNAFDQARIAAVTAGGTVFVGPGTHKLSASYNFPAGIQLEFAPGGKIKPAAGAVITLSCRINAGRYPIFDLSLGGSVNFTYGRAERALPEWWGAVGTGLVGDAPANVTAITAAINAVHAGMVSLVPTNGSTLGKPAPVIFSGHYAIDGEIVCPAYVNCKFEDGAVLQQTNAKRRVFVNNTDFYFGRFHKPCIVGGTRHFDFSNPNSDATTLEIDGPELQVSSDYAVHTFGLAGWTSPVAATTLTVAADAGDTTITVTSAAGFAAKQQIAVVNDRGEYHVTHVASIAGSVITMRAPIPAHWIGAGEFASIGKAVKTGDFHMSCTARLGGMGRVYNCRRILYNVCDAFAVSGDIWLHADKVNVDQNRALFVNAAGALTLERIVGVPVMGTTGVDRVTGARWIDNYDKVYADRNRFGGEDAGMPIVYNYATVAAASPYAGGQIIITRSQTSSGPTAESNSGVITLFEVPALIEIRGNWGIVSVPMIRADASLNLDTYFDAITDPHSKFKILLEPNMAPSEVAMPAQLRPYVSLQDKHRAMAAAPTTGWWAQGQRVENTAPTVVLAGTTDYVITGWICTGAGEPGTWVEMRTLTGT